MPETKISCPVCSAKEEILEDYTRALNDAKAGQDKIEKAQVIIREVDKLLESSGHDGSVKCQAFRQAASLKKQVAEMVTKLHGPKK